VAVFTAFSDKSGSQDPRGSFLVGGYIASLDTWDSFTSAAQEILNKTPVIPYIHMIEIRREKWRHDQGISNPQAEDKVERFIHLIRDTKDLLKVSSEIEVGDLEDVLRREVQPHSIRLPFNAREPDYSCFLAFAVNTMRYVSDRYPNVEKVDFVVSRKGKVTDHIKAFHEEMRSWMREEEPKLYDLVGGLTPADMEDSPPLQAADVFCWHLRRAYETGVQDNNAKLLMDCEGLLHRWTSDSLATLAGHMIRWSGL